MDIDFTNNRPRCLSRYAGEFTTYDHEMTHT